MKDTIIRCKSEEEYKAVLEKLEEKGCMWLSGHKPTEITKYYRDGRNLLFVSDDIITTGSSDPVFFDKSDYENYEDITADDFIGNKPIVIYRVGRTVVALDQNTKETGVAKCHPTDVFDFKVGAKLAFSRLAGCKLVEFDGESETDVSEDTDTTKFKVGDTVKVKSDLVVDEIYYGSSSPLVFYRTMKTNEPLKIESVSPTGNYYCSNGYYYTPSMIKKYNEFAMDKFKVGDRVVLCTDLVVGNAYGGLTLLDGAMSCFGRVLTITYIYSGYGNTPAKYKCDNGYAYTEEMLINPRNAITIGSKIKVTTLSKVFPRYHEWVDKNVIESKDKVRYDYGATLKEHVTGTVITIAPHLRYKNTKLVYFEYDGKCYLFDIDGVEMA